MDIEYRRKVWDARNNWSLPPFIIFLNSVILKNSSENIESKNVAGL